MNFSNLLLTMFLLVGLQQPIQEPNFSFEKESPFEKDKAFLLEYYETTGEKLEAVTRELSSAQLQYKSSPDSWSVGQVLEHIVMTEAALFKMTEGLMNQEANPERRSEIKSTDEDLISGVTNRSEKFKAPQELQPSGKYTEADAALKEFREQRNQILDYVRNASEEDLRDHISDSPFGPIDGYQSLLFIPGHTARHTLQIEEVLADSGFPKE